MPDISHVINALEASVSQNIKLLTHQIVQNEPSKSPLESETMHEQRVHQELSQYMLYAKKRCVDGFFSCFDEVKNLAQNESEIDLMQLEQNVTSAFSQFDTVPNMQSLFTVSEQQHACWKDLLGLTDTTLQLLYRGAKQLIDKGNHPEAEAAFFFLTTVDFRQYPFWLGLGHAAFHLGNHNQAINAYAMASSCDPKAFWPHVLSANCFEALNDYEEALSSLELALAHCQNADEKDIELEEGLKERIRKAKNLSSQ
jgi:tetratricopeptide (TPR) repeat protein